MIRALIGRLAAGILLGLAAAGGASAQNYDGNGQLRFGLFAGGEFYDVSSKEAPDFGSQSLDGAMVGFSFGYDLIFDRRFVLGIETDLQVGDTTGDVLTFKAHADYLATVRGRIGVYLMPQFLVYGTGGAAWSALGIENAAAAGLAGDLDVNRTSPGWIAGGGFEYDMKDYLGSVLFAEYLVGGFNTWNNVAGIGGSLDTDVQTFRVGLKFKIGHDYHEERGRYAPMK